DELIAQDDFWKIEFVAREGGLDWLLAAVARSGAETIAEGLHARLRICANPRCGLFFYDNSRTRRRRWCSMAVCGNRSKVAAFARKHGRSEERRVGKSVDLGGRRNIKKKRKKVIRRKHTADIMSI